MSTPQDPSHHSVTVDRSPLFLTDESHQFLFDNGDTITLTGSHPLFDIPVMDTYEAFCGELDQVNAEETFNNDYDGVDVLCFKAERAISNVIEIDQFETQSIEHATSVVQSSDSLTSFSTFTEDWFTAFIEKYNRLLYEETPEAFETLRTAAQTLGADAEIAPSVIVQTIATELEIVPDDC